MHLKQISFVTNVPDTNGLWVEIEISAEKIAGSTCKLGTDICGENRQGDCVDVNFNSTSARLSKRLKFEWHDNNRFHPRNKSSAPAIWLIKFAQMINARCNCRRVECLLTQIKSLGRNFRSVYQQTFFIPSCYSWNYIKIQSKFDLFERMKKRGSGDAESAGWEIKVWWVIDVVCIMCTLLRV